VAGLYPYIKKLIEEREKLERTWAQVEITVLAAFPSLSPVDIGKYDAPYLVELLAKAEKVMQLRNQESVSYTIDDEKLEQVRVFEAQMKAYWPDAYDEVMRGLNKSLFDDDITEELPDTMGQEQSDALMTEAIEYLQSWNLS